jgi:hypothetical protein
MCLHSFKDLIQIEEGLHIAYGVVEWKQGYAAQRERKRERRERNAMSESFCKSIILPRSVFRFLTLSSGGPRLHDAVISCKSARVARSREYPWSSPRREIASLMTRAKSCLALRKDVLPRRRDDDDDSIVNTFCLDESIPLCTVECLDVCDSFV